MKYEIKENTKTNAVLEISASREEFEEGLKKAFNKNKNRFSVPGFRKGKAPMSLVVKMYGEEILYEDAVNFVLPDIYEKAVEESGLDVVSRPEMDIVSIGEGDGFTVTAKVVLKPEVVLKSYKGIKAEKPEYNYTEEEVDAEINSLREKTARTVEIEDRGAENGDTVNIDYEGFSDGVAFDGGKATGYDLILGSNSFIPGFEDQIVGKKSGEEFEISVKFPEEYHSEELKGKDAVFKITLHKITKKEYAELDDEFAKDVSEFDTLEELKKSIREKLAKANEERTKHEFENNVLGELIKAHEIDIPDCMIEEKAEQLVRDFNMRLQQQGLDPKFYLQYTNQTEEDVLEQHKPQAKDEVALSLIMEAIIAKEKLEVSEEEAEAKLAEMAENYKMEVDKLKGFINIEEYKKQLLMTKAIELVVNAAVAKAPEKAAAKKAPAKKEPAEKKAPAKKTAAKKASEPAEKKAPAKKTTAKKAEGEKPAKKPAASKKTKKTEE